MEGANEIDGKLSFVILNLSFEIFGDEGGFRIFGYIWLNFYENCKFQWEKQIFYPILGTQFQKLPEIWVLENMSA